MYKFLYNKTCDIIDKIILCAQVVVGVVCLIIGIIYLCFDTAKVVWIISVIIWWVVNVFDGWLHLYKRSAVTLPDPDWLPSDKHENIKEAREYRRIAIDTKRDYLFVVGATEIILSVLMIITMCDLY